MAFSDRFQYRSIMALSSIGNTSLSILISFTYPVDNRKKIVRFLGKIFLIIAYLKGIVKCRLCYDTQRIECRAGSDSAGYFRDRALRFLLQIYHSAQIQMLKIRYCPVGVAPLSAGIARKKSPTARLGILLSSINYLPAFAT